MSTINRIDLAKRFGRDERGNTAIIFGLSAVPALTLIGAAIDYSSASNMQLFLQNLIDAGTIAAVREYGNSGDATKAEQRLRDYVLAGLQDRLGSSLRFRCWKDGSTGEDDYEYTDQTNITTNPTCAATTPSKLGETSIILKNTAIDKSTSVMNPNISMNFQTAVMTAVGMKYITISATAAATLSGKKLEVALMLDTTGSMSEYAGNMTKMAGLKLAAKDMFDIFSTGLSTGATRIAVVPFAEGVNPGVYNSVVRGSSPASTKTFTTRKYNKKGGGYASASYRLTNCVVDRYGADAITDESPGSSLFSPLYNSSGTCAEASTILPLTSSQSTLQSKIDGLTPNGSTPGHLGTQWAWYMLSPNWSNVWPSTSTPAAYDDKTTMKAAILMTDGEYNLQFCQGVDDQTINCSDPNGNSATQALAFCQKMKDAGITVYTIGFGIDTQSAKDTLSQCASTDPNNPAKKYYYFPYSSDEIRAAFQDIGNTLRAGQAGVQMTQ